MLSDIIHGTCISPANPTSPSLDTTNITDTTACGVTPSCHSLPEQAAIPPSNQERFPTFSLVTYLSTSVTDLSLL